MSPPIPKASVLDSAWFNLFHVVPYLLRGIFTRRRAFVSLFAILCVQPFSPRWGRRLKKKYGSYFYINMAGRKSLAVMELDGIRHVLDNSPAIYAETGQKRRGMSKFQPAAVTISRGDEWRKRREFNEAVLASTERVHPDAAYFLEAIRELTQQICPESWPQFEQLFDRVMCRVVFGDIADSEALSDTLGRLMRQGNLVALRAAPKARDGFLEEIRQRIASPAAHGLISRCMAAAPSQVVQAESQVPHWMFAIKETVAANTVQALALVATDADARRRVRDELRGADIATPLGIDRLRFLEGCIQEAMRLWPTTALLARESVIADTLGGEDLPAGTQVLIFNNYLHRDREGVPDADQFVPGRWEDGRVDYRFNHLSNGRQECAGKHLALFLAKSCIASLLDTADYELLRPRLGGRPRLPQQFDYFRARFRRSPR